MISVGLFSLFSREKNLDFFPAFRGLASVPRNENRVSAIFAFFPIEKKAFRKDSLLALKAAVTGSAMEERGGI